MANPESTLRIEALTFNPFLENTYVVWEAGQPACALVDPGMYGPAEQEALVRQLEAWQLRPVAIWQTHCHIDHVFGTAWAAQHWNLPIYAHPAAQAEIDALPRYTQMMGITADHFEVSHWVEPGQQLALGEHLFDILHTPGHSPGSIVLHHRPSQRAISGDVLFQGSIGRYDLPGADGRVLRHSIMEVLLPLGDDLQIFPGHGPVTTVGHERQTNPFLQPGFGW
jgi:glyoxylase-like metal-dependent hydrolase (beta-lactamase superfamily II)